MDELHNINQRLEALRSKLRGMRPLTPSVLAALREKTDLEITYTSNAIEGNTLTLRETTEVIERGITLGNKPLKDYLEAQDHHHALDWVYEVASNGLPLTQGIVRNLHKLVLERSKPDIAGAWAKTPRGISGTDIRFPPAWQVEYLMSDFDGWLRNAPTEPEQAFDAHYRLVSIHPFDDGNGRTARLLMNLMLIRGGYRPVAVRPADRNEYLDGLELGQTVGDTRPFQLFMHQRLEQTMSEYVQAVRDTVRMFTDRDEVGDRGGTDQSTDASPTPAQIAQWQRSRGMGRG